MVARIGKLEPRYSVLLNPHADTRLSGCPHCQKPTHPRKFALLIHVDGWGPFAQGKTCKFCSKCSMVIIQQDDLEAELAMSSARVAPEMAGQEYFLIGVVEGKHFKAGLDLPRTLESTLAHTSDFKTQYGLGLRRGGWYEKGKQPPVLPARRDQIVPGADVHAPTRDSQ